VTSPAMAAEDIIKSAASAQQSIVMLFFIRFPFTHSKPHATTGPVPAPLHRYVIETRP
jgi:hypothetical protein